MIFNLEETMRINGCSSDYTQNVFVFSMPIQVLTSIWGLG